MILGILVLSFFLRVLNLSQSLWLDESIQVMAASTRSLQSLLTEYMVYDFHPPLYSLLLYVWTALFGTSEAVVRFPSVLTGVGTVYLVYLIGKLVWDERTGFVSAFLLALSSYHIYYSQEARMYALATFFVALSSYFFLLWLRKKGSLTLYVVSLLLVFYTDYLASFILIPHLVYMYVKERKKLKEYFSGLGKGAVFLFPLVPLFIAQLKRGMEVTEALPVWRAVVGGATFKEAVLLPIKFSIGRISFENPYVYGGVAGSVVLLFGVLILRAFLKERKRIYFLALWLSIPPLVLFALSFFVPVFSVFRLLFILPAMYLILASGLRSLKPTFQQGAFFLTVAVFVVCLNIFLASPKFSREDWKGAASFLRSNMDDTDGVLLLSQVDAPMRYYLKNDALLYDYARWKEIPGTIWLVSYAQPIFEPDDTTRRSIEEAGYKRIGERDFNTVTVYEYRH